MCLVKLRIGLENRAITIIDLLEWKEMILDLNLIQLMIQFPYGVNDSFSPFKK